MLVKYAMLTEQRKKLLKTKNVQVNNKFDFATVVSFLIRWIKQYSIQIFGKLICIIQINNKPINITSISQRSLTRLTSRFFPHVSRPKQGLKKEAKIV